MHAATSFPDPDSSATDLPELCATIVADAAPAPFSGTAAAVSTRTERILDFQKKFVN
jgi:hypothetical protein